MTARYFHVHCDDCLPIFEEANLVHEHDEVKFVEALSPGVMHLMRDGSAIPVRTWWFDVEADEVREVHGD